MSRRVWRFALVLTASGGVAAAGLLAYQSFYLGPLEEALHRPYAAHRGAVLFRVGRGSTAESIANRLEASGIVADREFFLWEVTRAELGSRLQAGLYRFEGPLSPAEVIGRIVEGEVATLPVTVPEGLDQQTTATLLAEQGAGDPDALLAVFSDPEAARHLIGDLDPEAEDLEGYLFPSTYRLPPEADPEQVAAVLVGSVPGALDGPAAPPGRGARPLPARNRHPGLHRRKGDRKRRRARHDRFGLLEPARARDASSVRPHRALRDAAGG